MASVPARRSFRAEAVLLDSMNDARAARAAGAAFVAVTHGYRSGLEPEALGADLLIDSLEQLVAHLDLPPGSRADDPAPHDLRRWQIRRNRPVTVIFY